MNLVRGEKHLTITSHVEAGKTRDIEHEKLKSEIQK
jgi:hypothetical protein